MTRTMCDNNVYAGYRFPFPAGTIADMILNRGPAGDTIIITDDEFKEAKRYYQCMDALQKYPDILPKLVKISDGNVYKLRANIYNVFETRVNTRDLRDVQNSPTELRELIASMYAKKSNYKTKIR